MGRNINGYLSNFTNQYSQIGVESDSYKTILNPSEGLFKDKGSKFIAQVFHVETEDECKEVLQSVKKSFHDARHHCYAYRINPENEESRSNDDGEPSGTAGKPILNQILSYELFNVMVVVVRYFGGTKLGVSGLISAYKTATREALDNAVIVNQFLTSNFLLKFDYPLMNDIMRVIKEENLESTAPEFTDSCVIKIEIKKNNTERIKIRLEKLHGLTIKAL